MRAIGKAGKHLDQIFKSRYTRERIDYMIRVMVVEDEEQIRNILTKMIERTEG